MLTLGAGDARAQTTPVCSDTPAGLFQPFLFLMTLNQGRGVNPGDTICRAARHDDQGTRSTKAGESFLGIQGVSCSLFPIFIASGSSSRSATTPVASEATSVSVTPRNADSSGCVSGVGTGSNDPPTANSTNDATHTTAARLRVGNQKRGRGRMSERKRHRSRHHTYENQQSAHVYVWFLPNRLSGPRCVGTQPVSLIRFWRQPHRRARPVASARGGLIPCRRWRTQSLRLSSEQYHCVSYF